ncbi:MAG: ABC transporter substrate-binding protein [Candidatus Limnocylindrales bacterium]
MRIVSLIPAATEIVYALGLGDELVGRSPADDHPADVADVPVVAWVDEGDEQPPGPPSGMAGEHAERPSPHHIDLDALARARPDLILTQRLCQVCAVSVDQVEAAVRTLGIDPTIVALEASSIEGILNSISTVGAFAEAEDEAVGLIEILRQRLAAVEDRVLERRLAGVAPRRVVVLEWLEPPFSSGHWVPEMVRRAGGWDLLGQEGQVSTEVSWDRVRDVDPDQLVLAPCGMDADEAVEVWEGSMTPIWFDSLRAVQSGDLVAVDGGGLLSRPGPRVIDGIATLAEVFDPEGLAGFAPAGSWRSLGRAAGR